MKKLTRGSLLIMLIIASLFLAVSQFATSSVWAMSTEDMHTKMLYPVLRVNDGGSGTVIYSKPGEEGWSNYVLTNYHVISDAIRITEKWDSTLKKEVKTEKRGIIYCEIFKYQNLSNPIGTLKVESNIVLYNEDEDLALIKLSLDEEIPYIASLMPRNEMKNLYIMDPTCAVGCSLGWPPIPAMGRITRKNTYIDSLPYHMSSSQIIFGNSGGAIYKTGETEALFIGIPSRVPIIRIGFGGDAITHMGLFIPWDRICNWLEKEHYDFLFDSTKTEKGCLEEREKEIENKLNGE